jgi:NADH-quinone oxidoreductase subunit C
MLPFEELFALVKGTCTNGEAIADEVTTPKAVKINALDLRTVCVKLRQDPTTYFDMLSCITGVDNGPESGTMEVIYNLYSIPFNHHLTLKVMLDRRKPVVDSIETIWKTANWHERETFDLFGITFNGHSDLRRILLPGDWEGFPLRKDYKHQEYYRHVKVEY